MDSLFTQNWQNALKYKSRSIYFVYNPYVDGLANFTWLINHLPPDYVGRIFFDVEVACPGYSSIQYAQDLLTCILLTEKTNKVAIYTGAGSYGLCNPWPNRNEWLAWYPDFLSGIYTNWNDFVEKVLTIVMPQSISKYAIGTVVMNQITGGGAVLPGMNGEGVDISVFLGNEDQLVDYFGNSSGSIVTPIPTPIVISGSPLNYKVLTNLNIRSGPGINYSIIGGLQTGTIVNALDTGGISSWIETSQGWICKQLNNNTYLKLID